MVRGVNIGPPWTTDRLLVKGSGVQVLVMFRSFGFVGSEGDEKLFLGAAGGQSSLLYTGFSCMTCNFVLLSLKSNLVSH